VSCKLYLRSESVEIEDEIHSKAPDSTDTQVQQNVTGVQSSHLLSTTPSLTPSSRFIDADITAVSETATSTSLIEGEAEGDSPRGFNKIIEPTSQSIKDKIMAQYGSGGGDPDSEEERETEDDSDVNIKHAKIRIRIMKSSQSGEAEDIESLTSRLREYEGDYLFRKVDAEAEFKIRHQELQDIALLARLRGLGDSHHLKPTPPFPMDSILDGSTGKRKKKAPKRVTAARKPVPSIDVSDDDGPMLGLLEISTNQDIQESNTLVEQRSMPIPLHWGGKTPTGLLKEIVHKMDRAATIVYANSSGHSRVARARVTIRFTGGKTKTYDMTNIGCTNWNEAEQYIATIALHSLTFPPSRGFASGGPGSSQTFFRLLPPTFVDLWRELEEDRVLSEDQANTQIWLQLSNTLQTKLESNLEVSYSLNSKF
jgi:ATP-dependent RNA helicase DHX29